MYWPHMLLPSRGCCPLAGAASRSSARGCGGFGEPETKAEA